LFSGTSARYQIDHRASAPADARSYPHRGNRAATAAFTIDRPDHAQRKDRRLAHIGVVRVEQPVKRRLGVAASAARLNLSSALRNCRDQSRGFLLDRFSEAIDNTEGSVVEPT